MNNFCLIYGIFIGLVGASLFTPVIIPQSILALGLMGAGAYLINNSLRKNK